MALNPPKPSSRRARRRRSLTAAAETLSSRIERVGGQGARDVGEPWQREAWDLFDRVPELRTAARITGGAMSQCRLVIARVQANGEPAPLKPDEDHPAKALLQGFAGGAGGQADLLDAIGVALTVPGETILVGALDPREGLKDDFLRMQAYSTEQVSQRNGTAVIHMDESTRADRTIQLTKPALTEDGEEVEVDSASAIRIWRPHPRFSWQADSAARSALAVLQEIAGYDEHIEASRLSRLAGAGIFAVPEGMTLPGLSEDDLDPVGNEDPFLALLMQVMSLAIRDRKSAAAMVPLLMRGTPEDIQALTHLTFTTPFDEKVADLRDRAISRLASAVDMPDEILTGMGDANAWVGALITDDWKKGTLQTLMGFVCGSLTTGWLYPALVATGSGDVGSDIIIWFDDSSVRTRENTGPEALGIFDRGGINMSALRRALGYDDQDSLDLTTDEGKAEVLLTLAFKNPSMVPLMLPLLNIDLDDALLERVTLISAALRGGAAPSSGDPQSDLPPETGGGAAPEPTTIPSKTAAGLADMLTNAARR